MHPRRAGALVVGVVTRTEAHERFRQVVARGTAKAEREEAEHLARLRATRELGPRRRHPPALTVRRPR